MYVNELHSPGIRALMDYDHTLFDNMTLPDGVSLDDVVNHIIYTFGDTPLFIADPDILKYYHTKWSARRLPVWNKYKALLAIQYSPLENYDRQEDTTITNTGTQTYDHTGDDTTTRNGEDELARTGYDDLDKDGTETTTNSRSAYNSSSWEAEVKSELEYGNTRKDTYNYNSTDTRTYTNLADKTEYNSTNERTDDLSAVTDSRIHGNIGVTTSQQMFMAEVGVIPYYDLINYIAQDWHQEFCLGLYY